MRLCKDCKYYFVDMGDRCRRTKITCRIGHVKYESCNVERWVHFLPWRHCGPRGRYWEPENKEG